MKSLRLIGALLWCLALLILPAPGEIREWGSGCRVRQTDHGQERSEGGQCREDHQGEHIPRCALPTATRPDKVLNL